MNNLTNKKNATIIYYLICIILPKSVHNSGLSIQDIRNEHFLVAAYNSAKNSTDLMSNYDQESKNTKN